MNIEEKIRKNVGMSRYTTFKIGGAADSFVAVKSEKELKEAVLYAKSKGIRIFIIGDGSNLLVNDAGYRGIIIRNSIKGVKINGSKIVIKAGETLEKLVMTAKKSGLSGCEFAAGIPGTVGGAVYGNAGAYGRSMSDILVSAKIMDFNGNVKVVDREYFRFDYRWSALKESQEVVIEAVFQLEPKEIREIDNKIKEIIHEREGKHPPYPWMCAGSYFKNLPPETEGGRKVAAGLILDKCGVKGMKHQGAKVYECHANFIMNGGKAKCSDVIGLAKILKEMAKEKFNVTLEEEVMYLGEEGISCNR